MAASVRAEDPEGGDVGAEETRLAGQHDEVSAAVAVEVYGGGDEPRGEVFIDATPRALAQTLRNPPVARKHAQKRRRHRHRPAQGIFGPEARLLRRRRVGQQH